jgi:hypothetical protein
MQSDVPSAMELKFYPIIPNVINVLTAEFAKRNTRVSFRAVDEYTFKEILENKRLEIENVLVRNAEVRLVQNLISQGADPNDPEIAEQLRQATSLENLKKLPEIEDFFSKKYEVIVEKWASRQHRIDEERFYMDELEAEGFYNKLVTDREFWHFKMLENDYDVELWNPVLTFYHKSPDMRYISDGAWVGKIEMMTVSDVIDKYGWTMNQEQLESLQHHLPVQSINYGITGQQNDGSFYDASKSHAWNTEMPSLAYRQFTSVMDNFVYGGGDIVKWILGESEDYMDFGTTHMLRVTTAYWKSQMKIGYLTAIGMDGRVINQFVSEDYEVTNKPIYNTQLFKHKDTRNLIFGEHVEWIWINQVWGGIKIGPNMPSFWGQNNTSGINPIYLGINQNKILPLKFQFKGDKTEYGCKLPVEGRVFSDRNTNSISLVDLMKPFQIGYNIVNNQISDILVSEIGTFVLLDQNALPKYSLNEDWGTNNYAKAMISARDFSVLPLDTSMANTGGAGQFAHYQQLDLSQTNRLLSRVQLANHFKSEAFQVVGVNLQRMGQQIGQYQSATGVEQELAASYAQTEIHFIQHSDELMPRVHQMRTNLAQYYHVTNPSIRLQYMTTNDERVNFEINGTDLMSRDINVFCTTKSNYRHILEEMKKLAMNNNTAGASIYDLGNILQADSLGTLNATLKSIEERTNQAREKEMQYEQQMKQMEIEQRTKEKQMELDHKSLEEEKNRRKDILVAEIRAAGYGSMMDIDKNEQSDYLDALGQIQKTDEFEQTMSLKRDRETARKTEVMERSGIEREKMNLQRELKEKDLHIARENRNRFDVPNVKDRKK